MADTPKSQEERRPEEMLHAVRQFIPTIEDANIRNALAKLTSEKLDPFPSGIYQHGGSDSYRYVNGVWGPPET